MMAVRRVVVHQPQFLPWIGFWHKIVSADVYIVYSGVKFDQYDHEHRVTVNGHWVTLPVEKHSRSKLIRDVRISNSADCKRIAASLRHTFCKAPYRDRLGDVFHTLETWDSPWLHELDTMLFLVLAGTLGIEIDTRFDCFPREHLPKVNKLDTCLREHMQTEPFIYLQGAAASQSYLSKESLTSPLEVWTQHVRPEASPDSILHLLAHDAEPMTAIRDAGRWHAMTGETYAWDGLLCL